MADMPLPAIKWPKRNMVRGKPELAMRLALARQSLLEATLAEAQYEPGFEILRQTALTELLAIYTEGGAPTPWAGLREELLIVNQAVATHLKTLPMSEMVI